MKAFIYRATSPSPLSTLSPKHPTGPVRWGVVAPVALDPRPRKGLSPAQVHTVGVDGWSGDSSPQRHPRPGCPAPHSPFTLCIAPSGEGDSAGKSERTANPEESRSVCLGHTNAGQYDPFYLENTAKCFTNCGQVKDESCNLENLQR